jgi:hypothetical protein
MHGSLPPISSESVASVSCGSGVWQRYMSNDNDQWCPCEEVSHSNGLQTCATMDLKLKVVSFITVLR